MGKQSFMDFIKNNIVILDGATGTELQKEGMPLGVSPEKWALENPEILMNIQKNYINAGSNVIYTCTFGGNRLKLSEFGLADKVVEINRDLAKISKEAVGDNGFVAGDIAATGQFIEPFGEMPFEEAVEIYKEQVNGLLEGGVDLFIIETMVDIQEARAALIAVKESCDLPVCVSMTFDESRRTLTGTDPITALITLQSLGADIVGCNCSTGPKDMIEVIKEMKPYAKVPLLAKPNAGLPRLVNGKTEFDMGVSEFASYVKDFAEAGVNLLGGCCGTSPLYIAKIKESVKTLKPKAPDTKKISCVTSARKTVFTGFNEPVVVIGERINPTGKKKLQQELKESKTNEIRRFASEQIEKGANILDVNVGMPGVDEKKTMIDTVQFLSTIVEAPLCIDSSSPEVIEAALRVYPGRAIINSISGEKKKVETLLPIAAKYGAMFIFLPLNDEGVPETAKKRCEIIENVYTKALKYGFSKEDIIVDGLVMTVSSDQNAAVQTLNVINWCKNEFGTGSILGLSNVSFGLPERSWVNTAFLAMAIGKGLTMAIANPSSEILMNIKMACDVLMAKDKNSALYIKKFSGQKSEKIKVVEEKKDLSTLDQIYKSVLTGNNENIKELINTAIKEGNEPSKIVDDYLIPAITKVGDLYDKKEYFLPQLIQSAQTMKDAFSIIEPLLMKKGGKENKKCIVLATVKGDIHDIGKNIVGLMLKNYGFKVIDLGKDVSSKDIVERAKKEKAHIIGLSALMTTTMVEMKEVVKLAKSEGVNSKIMIGGAVVDSDYAKEIGADGYSEDAYAAVKLAEKLVAF